MFLLKKIDEIGKIALSSNDDKRMRLIDSKELIWNMQRTSM